jgi:hypothetical protein
MVDGLALESAAREVARLPENLTASGQSLRRHEPHVGPEDLREALASFEDHWAHGRDKLAASAEDVARSLVTSAAAYEEVERSVTRAVTAPGTAKEKGT